MSLSLQELLFADYPINVVLKRSTFTYNLW